MNLPVGHACAEEGDEDSDDDESDVGEEEPEDGLAELAALPPPPLHKLKVATLLLYFSAEGSSISQVWRICTGWSTGRGQPFVKKNLNVVT